MMNNQQKLRVEELEQRLELSGWIFGSDTDQEPAKEAEKDIAQEDRPEDASDDNKYRDGKDGKDGKGGFWGLLGGKGGKGGSSGG